MSDKIDFSKLKHGAFTSQFKAYKDDHPSAKIKDLGQFADFVLKNHKKFQMKTIKRARFYNNVLRGGELTGGKLAVKDIKNLIDASYVKGNKSLDDFDIDNDLSDQYVKVYRHNTMPDHAVVVHRGSADLTDWYLDSKIARGKSIEDSARYKHSLEIQKKAEEKYGKDNVSTVGHSLGSYLSSKVGKDSKEVINLNKPVVPDNLLGKANEKEHTIRSSGDIVSVGQRFRNDKNDRVIQATTSNPLTEHSTGILDRLDANEMIGEGRPTLFTYDGQNFDGKDAYNLASKYLTGEGQPCLKKMSVKDLKAMLKKMPKKGGVRLTGTKKKDLRSACGKCGCPCCMRGGANAEQKGEASEMRQYIFEQGHKLKKQGKPFGQYAPLLDLADDLNAIVHSNDPEQTIKQGTSRRYNKLYDATNQYDPKAKPIIVKARPIYEPLHAPREAEYLQERAELDYIVAHSAWEKRLKDAIVYNRMVDIQTQLLDDFLAYKKRYDSAPPRIRKTMSYPRPKKGADTTFSPEKFPKENIASIQATEPKKPAQMTGSGMTGGWDFSGRNYSLPTIAYNSLLNGLTENYRSDITKEGVRQDVDRNIAEAKKFVKNPNPITFAKDLVEGQASRYGSGLEGGRDYSKDEGKSLGFFGNIKRAIDTSWNKQGTPLERKATSVLLNNIEPALIAPLQVIAPPVGKIADAQRKLLKSHYNL